jgi:hypothetical protein
VSEYVTREELREVLSDLDDGHKGKFAIERLGWDGAQGSEQAVAPAATLDVPCKCGHGSHAHLNDACLHCIECGNDTGECECSQNQLCHCEQYRESTQTEQAVTPAPFMPPPIASEWTVAAPPPQRVFTRAELAKVALEAPISLSDIALAVARYCGAKIEGEP